MRKLFLCVLMGMILVCSTTPAMALLRKDLGYVVGTVHSKEEGTKTIVIKDESGALVKFIADAEQFNGVSVGHNVMVSHQLNSNQIYGIFVRPAS